MEGVWEVEKGVLVKVSFRTNPWTSAQRGVADGGAFIIHMLNGSEVFHFSQYSTEGRLFCYT